MEKAENFVDVILVFSLLVRAALLVLLAVFVFLVGSPIIGWDHIHERDGLFVGCPGIDGGLGLADQPYI